MLLRTFPNGIVQWPSTYEFTSVAYGTTTYSGYDTLTSTGCLDIGATVTYHPSLKPSSLSLPSQSRNDTLSDPGGLLYTFGVIPANPSDYGLADPSPLNTATINVAGCLEQCVSGDVNYLTGPAQFMTSQIVISGDQTSYLPPTLAVPSSTPSSQSSPAVTSMTASPTLGQASGQAASAANSGTVPTTSSRTQSSESSLSYSSPKNQMLFSLTALIFLACI
jgi:hypothetical protein